MQLANLENISQYFKSQKKIITVNLRYQSKTNILRYKFNKDLKIFIINNFTKSYRRLLDKCKRT